jgi:hypothetical protein
VLRIVYPEIESTMDRLTNHYNSTKESEVSIVLGHVRGVPRYVVRGISDRLKHSARINRLIEVGPMVDVRRAIVKCGI